MSEEPLHAPHARVMEGVDPFGDVIYDVGELLTNSNCLEVSEKWTLSNCLEVSQKLTARTGFSFRGEVEG